MLRSAALLLLPRSGLRQAAAAASSGLLEQSGGGGSWIQGRSKSDDAGLAAGAAADEGQLPLEGELGVDLPTADILSQADELVAVSQAASDALVVASKGSVWFGTNKFIDIFMWSHDTLGVPW